MKILQTVISRIGFRNPDENEQRMDLLHKLIDTSKSKGAELLIVPAGFLSAHNDSDYKQILSEVEHVSKHTGLAIIGGIDVSQSNAKKDHTLNEQISGNSVPYFAFATYKDNKGNQLTKDWRQSSTTADNAQYVKNQHIPGKARVINIAGTSCAVLICGEIFSQQARESISDQKPDVIIDLGHSGMGQGLIPAMCNISNQTKSPVIHSQHLADFKKTSIHFVDSTSTQDSKRATQNPLIKDDEYWAGWQIRTVQESSFSL